jgi:chromosome segregation ATPase
MSQEARISSILVLKELRAALGTFAETAAKALEEASTEIQRARQWLLEDRYRYWKAQVQARSERFARAKIALKQKQVFDRTLGGTPTSCVDERKALKIAEARFREAEHKFRRVQAWSLRIEKEMSDYRGATQRLLSAIEVDIPNARARLDNMTDALEAYVALAPPEMPRSATEKAEADFVRSGEGSAPGTPADPSPAPPGPAQGSEALRETPPSPHENRTPDLESEAT